MGTVRIVLSATVRLRRALLNGVALEVLLFGLTLNLAQGFGAAAEAIGLYAKFMEHGEVEIGEG